MQLFENLTSLLKSTMFFNSYVKYWPEPLNDASFDVFILLLFVVMVIIPEIYYALQTRVVRFQLKKKNREYARIAAGSSKDTGAEEEMGLIDQYLKFLLVAHCIDKDIDISFEEWKEVKFGDGAKKEGLSEKHEGKGTAKSDTFSRVKETAGSAFKKAADMKMFGFVSGKRNKSEAVKKVTAIEDVKRKVEESSIEDSSNLIIMENHKKPEAITNKEDDGLDEFERILNSIKLKQNEKMAMSKKNSLDSALELKRRRSLESCLQIKDEENGDIIQKSAEDKKIYNAKEAAIKLKEKEMLRKKRQEERLLRKQSSKGEPELEEACSYK